MLRFHVDAEIPPDGDGSPQDAGPSVNQFPGPPVPEQSFFRAAAPITGAEARRMPAADALSPRLPRYGLYRWYRFSDPDRL